jgi:hypothetical protein
MTEHDVTIFAFCTDYFGVPVGYRYCEEDSQTVMEKRLHDENYRKFELVFSVVRLKAS